MKENTVRWLIMVDFDVTVAHVEVLPCRALPEHLDMPHGRGTRWSPCSCDGAQRQAMADRIRHKTLHRRVLRKMLLRIASSRALEEDLVLKLVCCRPSSAGNHVLWSRLLCSRHRDEGERPCLRHSLQPSLHDHHSHDGLHYSSRGYHLRKVRSYSANHLIPPPTADTFCWKSICRLLGAVIIVIGLYSLIWGKSKDHLTEPSPPREKEAALVKTSSIDHVAVIDIQPARNPRQ
ncbi:hypothetical protein BHE74_00008028 [Ensete ventricosum]|nr:hypothetical protein BHE74_00008028 [Ensete ventricosum]